MSSVSKKDPVAKAAPRRQESKPQTDAVAPQTDADAGVEATRDASAVSLSATAAAAAPPAVPAEPAADAPELGDVDEPLPFTGLLSSVLRFFGWTPLLSESPARAPEPPAAWALLAWVRRQVQETLFNKTPTAQSQQLAYSPTDGTVLGRMNAADAEGDTMMWRLVKGPTRGTVSLGADGSYTYTPDAEFADAGGIDTFIVSVRDVGLHLHLFNGTGRTLVAVPVSVTQVDPAPQVGLTRGFDIVNLTSHPLMFDKYNPKYDLPVAGPDQGKVFMPGETAHFELHRGAGVTRVDAHFVATDGSGVSFWGGMRNTSVFGIAEVSCNHSGGAACTPDHWSNGIVVGLLDPAGTVIRLGPEQAAAQRDVLVGLCNYGSQSTCTFKIDKNYPGTGGTGQAMAWTPWEQITHEVQNPNNTTSSVTRTYSQAVSESDSVAIGTKLGFKLGDIVNTEISTTYTHAWIKQETYAEGVTLTIPPFSKGWIEFQSEVYRVYGDFTLQMGDTRWVVEDTYWDTPIEGPTHGRFRTHVEPMTNEELAQSAGALAEVA